MTVETRIIAILRATKRPKIEDVIGFMEASGYFTKPGGGHHKEKGGLAQHCLEVYRVMKSTSLTLPSDSMAVAAFFHDLGKVERNRGHAARSLRILDGLGFQLTEDERFSIGHHHNNKALREFRTPLRRSLSFADSVSTGWWKARHPHRP